MCATKYAAKYQNLGIINIQFLYTYNGYLFCVCCEISKHKKNHTHTHTQFFTSSIPNLT